MLKAFTEYVITDKSVGVLNVLPSKATAADYLQNDQHFNCTDESIAFDSSLNSGTIGKVLGAVFGKTAVHIKHL
jgi:hypothetical protein